MLGFSKLWNTFFCFLLLNSFKRTKVSISENSIFYLWSTKSDQGIHFVATVLVLCPPVVLVERQMPLWADEGLEAEGASDWCPSNSELEASISHFPCCSQSLRRDSHDRARWDLMWSLVASGCTIASHCQVLSKDLSLLSKENYNYMCMPVSGRGMEIDILLNYRSSIYL